MEPTLNRISLCGNTVQLKPKVMDVLTFLAERADQLVTREQLFDTVWAVEYITDNTLTHAIAELRSAFGDDVKSPSYIETIHGRGYRLIASVDTEPHGDAGPDGEVVDFPARRRERSEARSPYPGLSPFGMDDAEFFVGREHEVGLMWRKLTDRRLLALIGPSGVGKSSFLRAGLLPVMPGEWGSLVCQPGEDPLMELARTVVGYFEGDAEAVRPLLGGVDSDSLVAILARWRERHEQILLIVDQFEELFTLNSADGQDSYASLLRRLVDDVGVHVLLSIRDDFLYRCHSLPHLQPIFEAMTPLAQPSDTMLKRALIEPAARFGYAFEDDEMASEMVAEIADARAALPLLAFAVSRLWERRDRELRLLTRQAYSDIGGVGGALARHAEATVRAVGNDQIPIVREVFRNLVTAEGTRAIRDRNEILSVFSESGGEAPERVLRALIDARLLTSYESHEDEKEPTRRVEIIHESLLEKWPRLVGWQTQDADSARLREELRQAARAWEEHGRHNDRLWTGTAFREYRLWSERYSGGLTDIEKAFSSAMTAFATRNRRHRRVAVAAAFAALIMVLAVVGTLWRRSVLETRGAEASKLLAIGQSKLHTDPTEALAYVTASLQVADVSTGRQFVMRALWEAPPALVLDCAESDVGTVRFSPEGNMIAAAGFLDVATIWSDAGEEPVVLDPPGKSAVLPWGVQWASQDLIVTGLRPRNWSLEQSVSEDFLITGMWPREWGAERVFVWSMPEGRLLRTIEFEGRTAWHVAGNRLFSETSPSDPAKEGLSHLQLWRLPDGEPEDLGWIDRKVVGASSAVFDPSGNAWIYAEDRTILARSLPTTEGGRDRVIGAHDTDGVWLTTVTMNGVGLILSSDREGELRVWAPSRPGTTPLRVIPRPEGAPAPFRHLFPGPTGRWVRHGLADQVGKSLLWDLSGLPGARPLELRRSGSWMFSESTFHPAGDWAVATTRGGTEVSFWPLHGSHPSIVEGASHQRKGLAFSPDGRWLAATWPPGNARLFQVPGKDRRRAPKLAAHSFLSTLIFDPASERLAGGNYGNRFMVVPLDGGDPQVLEGFLSGTVVESAAFSPSGRLIAAASGLSESEKTLRVWDLDTGESEAFDLPRSARKISWGYENNVQNLWFTDEGTLFTVGATGFLKWNLNDGSNEEVVALREVGYRTAAASADGLKVLIIENPEGHEGNICDTPKLHDLASGTAEALPRFGNCVRVIALNPGGTVAVTGDASGIVRVGPVAGGQPHLLAGHEGAVEYVSISPDLQWVASVGSDSTLRLWPMPELSNPPLHTLPHDELIAKLKSLTNLRVVRDGKSATGWKLEAGPFPGWETVPSW